MSILDERAPRLRAILNEAGYRDEMLAFNYPVWLGGHTVHEIDMVGFCRTEPADMSTSAFVCSFSEERRLSGNSLATMVGPAAALGAPLIFVARSRDVDVYATREGEPIFWRSISYSDPTSAAELRIALAPMTLLRAKRSLQLTLIPIDAMALTRARKQGARWLSERVEHTIATTSQRLNASSNADWKLVCQIVVRALCTVVLADKQNDSTLPPSVLGDIYLQRYSQYFDFISKLGSTQRSAFDTAVDDLHEGINYRSLDPTVLNEVYQDTLVTDEVRRSLGIHYTPPALASTMLNMLPIEYLAPEKRIVLDPACGSGTLLIAAHSRLQDLQPTTWNAVTSHEDLTKSLHGWDSDWFATEIAQLGLFLHALPTGNGWDIKKRDALSLESPAIDPSIIITNPPWRFEERTELADVFVNKVLDILAPEGLLGLILPISWTTRKNNAARERLLRECDVFETWRLPEHTFSDVKIAPCVFLAQKRATTTASSQRPGRVFRRVTAKVTSKEVRRDRRLVYEDRSVDAFMTSGVADEVLLQDASAPLIQGSLSQFLTEDTSLVQLQDIADVRNGPQPYPGISPSDSGSGNVRFFISAKIIRPFDHPSTDQLLPHVYPDNFRRGRNLAGLVGRRKILTPVLSDTSNPWRLRAGIADPGVIGGLQP